MASRSAAASSWRSAATGALRRPMRRWGCLGARTGSFPGPGGGRRPPVSLARRKREGDAAPLPVRRVGIIGGGTSGSGIAAAFAASGFDVTLCDSDRAALQRGREAVATALADLTRGGGNTEAVNFADTVETLA